MRKSDYLGIGVLMLAPILIFYPLFTAEYLYMDEALQLWRYNVDPGFQMFTYHGRYLTEKMMQWFFGSISTIHEVSYLRLFSLMGWVLSIPVWYVVLKKIIAREGFPPILAFCCVFYIIVMPPVTIYVSWASCLEIFLAALSGFLSGYFVYRNIYFKENKIRVRPAGVVVSLLLGLLSLFLYQTGFSCFLLPFFIKLVGDKKLSRVFWLGVGAYFSIYIIYFLLFKATVLYGGVPVNSRAGLYFDPIGKLKFFLFRPLVNSFRFTLILAERSFLGFAIYGLLAGGWLVLNFLRFRMQPLWKTLLYFSGLFFLLLCMYLPGLVVRESFASHRTMFAVNLAVFLLVVETLFYLVRNDQSRKMVVIGTCTLFFINASYNLQRLFLAPITHEYRQLRGYVETNYHPGVHTVHFIRPEQDFFVRRHKVPRSYDEFGAPSTFSDWVPESWVRQVVFEQTGDRQVAEKLMVKQWTSKNAYRQSGEQLSNGVVLMDVEAILSR